jgi:hypothetical protein
MVSWEDVYPNDLLQSASSDDSDHCPLLFGMCDCWNLIKGPLAPSISPGFYSRTDRRGPSIMVSESGGLEFEPRSRIFRYT